MKLVFGGKKLNNQKCSLWYPFRSCKKLSQNVKHFRQIEKPLCERCKGCKHWNNGAVLCHWMWNVKWGTNRNQSYHLETVQVWAQLHWRDLQKSNHTRTQTAKYRSSKKVHSCMAFSQISKFILKKIFPYFNKYYLKPFFFWYSNISFSAQWRR